MSDNDRRRWNRRHQSGRTQATPPFGAARLPEDLAGLRCLDVATGTGDVALWAARQGMFVTAVDISPVGLAHLTDAARGEGLDDRVTTVEHDLDEGLPAMSPFDLVVSRWFRKPELYSSLAALVTIGGWLSISVLGGAGSQAVAVDELLTAFGGLGEVLDQRSDDDGHQLLVRRDD